MNFHLEPNTTVGSLDGAPTQAYLRVKLDPPSTDDGSPSRIPGMIIHNQMRIEPPVQPVEVSPGLPHPAPDMRST